jgi:trehalose 2-sulfotransferase
VNPTGTTASTPIRFLTDRRLDFAGPVPLLKSYIVASSVRKASRFLCKSLWQTGRLGAPWEYLNASFKDSRGTLATPLNRSVASTIMQRLDAFRVTEYITKLIECRTSSNGVFGLKAHFDDFESAINEAPEILSMLAPVTYIYVDCRDKIAQAVAVVRELLTSNASSGRDVRPQNGFLRYDRDLISKCLGRLERQRLAWWRWFEANSVNPLVVYCEDTNTDIAGVVRTVMELLDVQTDVADEVSLPRFGPESDATADQWAVRFKREIQSGVDIREDQAAVSERISEFAAAARESTTIYTFGTEVQKHERQQIHPSDRAEQDFEVGVGPRTQVQPQAFMSQATPDVRQLPRYHQIIGKNRELLQGAWTLDLMSGNGLCSLAALDAGAAYVVGVDPRPNRVAAAERAFTAYGIPERSYRFVSMDITAALNDTEPESFDVILCRRILEQHDPCQFFSYLRRLRPRHVIFDTFVTPGSGPLIRFSRRAAQAEFPAEAKDRYTIVTTPSHELILLLCDYFGFRWRLNDGLDSTPPDWPAMRDAGREQMRTYVLDRTG